MWILGKSWLGLACLLPLDADGSIRRLGGSQGTNPPTRKQFYVTGGPKDLMPLPPIDSLSRINQPRSGILPTKALWPHPAPTPPPGVPIQPLLDAIRTYPGVKSADLGADGLVRIVLAGKDARASGTTITFSAAAKEIRYARDGEQGTLDLKDNGDQVTVTALPLTPPGARRKLDLGLLPALLSSLYDRLHEKP